MREDTVKPSRTERGGFPRRGFEGQRFPVGQGGFYVSVIIGVLGLFLTTILYLYKTIKH